MKNMQKTNVSEFLQFKSGSKMNKPQRSEDSIPKSLQAKKSKYQETYSLESEELEVQNPVRALPKSKAYHQGKASTSND